MGARHITGPLLRVCFGAVYKGVTPSKLLTDICEQIAFVQKDLDMTGDMDSHHYYEGMIDAYNTVAQWIAPFKDQAAYHELLGFKSPDEIAALVAEATKESQP